MSSDISRKSHQPHKSAQSHKVDLLSLPWLHRARDQVVAWRGSEALTNAMLQQGIDYWRNTLKQHAGKKFALYITDSFDFSCALLGAWCAGKTVVLPGDSLPATCTSIASMVDGFLGEFPAALAPIKLSQQWRLATPFLFDDQNSPPLSPDALGLVVHTSGSSGSAKAITKRLSQLSVEVDTLETLFSVAIGQSEIVATVSHQHIYGLLFKVLWPLAAGRAVHVQSAVFLEELVPLVTTRPCILVTSPAHLKRYPDAVPENRLHLNALFSSGGPLPLSTAHASARLFGVAPIEIYGSSETGGIAWRQRASSEPDQLDERIDDSWQPMPNVECRIEADNPGLLSIRSPHLSDQEWQTLADRAALTTDGRFVLEGRADRIVKLEEKRISLDAIEHCLQDCAVVSEVRILHYAPSDQRHRLVAFVALNAAGKAYLETSGKIALNNLLKKRLRDTFEPIAIPRSWRYVDALPVDAQGKTTHAGLLAELKADLTTGLTTELTTELTADLKAEFIKTFQPSFPDTARPTLPDCLILEQDQKKCVLQLTVPPELLYFEGHFPEAPVLPGVVQVDWAMTYARRHFSLPTDFAAVHALKFQQVIRPGMTIILTLEYDVEKSSVAFRLHAQDCRYASGRLLFTESPVR